MVKKTSHKISHYDEPFGKLTRIEDFLPAPEELFPKSEKQKITLEVDAEIVDFYKASARKQGTKYQRMMREVLKSYAKKYGS